MASNLVRLETSAESLLSYGHMKFNKVVLLRARESLKKKYISTFTKLMDTKLGQVQTTGRRFSLGHHLAYAKHLNHH